MSYPEYPNPNESSGAYAGFGISNGPSLAQQAADPRTTPEQLRAILQQEPSLAPVIAVNESIDDPLREWLWEYGGEAVKQAILDQYEQAQAEVQSAAAQPTAIRPEPAVTPPIGEQVAGFDLSPQSKQPAFGAFDSRGAFGAAAPAQAPSNVIDSVPGFIQSSPDAPVSQSSTTTAFESQPVFAAAAQAEEAFDEDTDKTILVRRNKRPNSRLRLESGDSVELVSDVIVLGRNPRGRFVGNAQVVRIPDAQRTISKTHAKLEWVEGGWFITDLESTNGVALGAEGDETEISPNTATPLHGPFTLGLYHLELQVE